jgi:hypothetical protein
MQEEIWKPIKGYEKKYSISNFGRIRNKRTSRITEGRIGNHGYKRVSFRKEGEIKEYLIHRLVAETFIENKQRKRTVNHIDGNKTNNNIENLEWATDKEQQAHAIKNGLRKTIKSCDNKLSKKVDQFNLDGTYIKTHNSIVEAKKELGSDLHISEVCRGKRKTTGGYIWSYSK